MIYNYIHDGIVDKKMLHHHHLSTTIRQFTQQTENQNLKKDQWKFKPVHKHTLADDFLLFIGKLHTHTGSWTHNSSSTPSYGQGGAIWANTY